MKERIPKKQKIIDVIQWMFIIALTVLCGCLVAECNERDNILEKKVKKEIENHYIKIYDSHTIRDLRHENKQLKDSLYKITNDTLKNI